MPPFFEPSPARNLAEDLSDKLLPLEASIAAEFPRDIELDDPFFRERKVSSYGAVIAKQFPEVAREILLARLFDIDKEYGEERRFPSVAEPDDYALEELRRREYIHVINEWLDGR